MSHLHHKNITIIRYLGLVAIVLFGIMSTLGSGGGGGGGTNTPPPSLPSSPTGITLDPSDNNIVTEWSAVTNADSYNIYFASSPGVTKANYASLPEGTKITNVTSPHTILGLTNGTTYYLVVTAVNTAGESSESAEFSATPLPVPNTPIGLTGSTGNSQITITWNSVPFADSYNLYLATEPGVNKTNYTTVENGSKTSSVTSPHVITGLANEIIYNLVVTAENTEGESAESMELATIPGSSGWAWQNPTPTGNDLQSVDFVDTNNGWVVGNGGTILHTNDGGTTWLNQWNNASIDFSDVSVVDASTAWVVGEHHTAYTDYASIVLSTIDGGVTWTQHAVPAGRGVDFISGDIGWVVGETGIYHTSDGGDTWSLQSSVDAKKVKFVDANHGWVVSGSGSGGTVYKTTDGGLTWSSQNLGSSLPDLDFIDINHGWIADYTATGAIYATTDGGDTWGPQPTTANYLLSIAFGDATAGWAVGTFGKIVHTTNGGGSWSAQTSGVSNHLMAVAAVDASNAWGVGAGGTILHTSNGGTTWNLQSNNPIPSSSGLYDVDFVDASNGWAVGRAIVYSSDGGSTWSSQVSGLSNALHAIDFVNSTTGWAVGDGSQILHTTDGGLNWNNQNSNGASQLWGVSFVDASTGWAVGPTGVIRKTTDGGVNWSSQTSGTTNVLQDVAFASTSTGWIVGDGGMILHTTDGGTTWLGQVSGTTYDLRDIFVLDTTTAWAVGGNSSSQPMSVLKTTDGGATWTTQLIGKNGWLEAVHFSDALNGWVSDYNGEIYATQDGGSTWVQQSSGVSYPHNIRGFSFINSTTGWAVGGGGTGVIIKTTTGGFSP